MAALRIPTGQRFRLSRIAWGTAFFLSLFHTASAQQGDDSLRLIEAPHERPSPYDEVPESFALSGVVVDQFGDRIKGLKVTARGEVTAVTDDHGHFALPGTVGRRDRVDFQDPDHVTISYRAQQLYSGDGGQAVVTVPRFAESFDIGPAGGTYKGGLVTLEVPEGAVAEPVTVRAATLPLEMTYNNTPGIEPVRFAGIDFQPTGLKFAKPITARVANAYTTQASDGAMVFGIDPKTGFWTRDPEASATVEGNETVFRLSHFSKYASGSPSEGMTRAMVKWTTDVNGDGKTTTEDAEFVVILAGGEHEAEYVKTTGSSAAVFKTTSSGISTSSTSSTTVSGGISFAGVGVDASATQSESETKEQMDSAGFGATSTKMESIAFKMYAPEYETECSYFLRWYQYWRIRKYKKITVNDRERQNLQNAYEGRSDKSTEWGYFKVHGPSGVTVGRTLYEGMRVAVRKTDSGYEFYAQSDEYLVRVPKGGTPIDCSAGNLAGMVNSGEKRSVDFFGGGEAMGDAEFTRTASGLRSRRYAGWGVLPDTTPDLHYNYECLRETNGTVTISNEIEESSEQSQKKSETSATSTSVSASASIPLPGGASGSIGISGEKASESTREEATSRNKKLLNSVSTEIKWSIIDPHRPRKVHKSDHELYKLHLLIETRDWKQMPDGSYQSGAPYVQQKEIGFLLLRVDERGCPGMPYTPSTPETPAPKPTETKPKPRGSSTETPEGPTYPGPGKPVITPSPNVTPPAPDRPPITPMPPPAETAPPPVTTPPIPSPAPTAPPPGGTEMPPPPPPSIPTGPM